MTIIMIGLGPTRDIRIQPYCLLGMLLYSVHRIAFKHALIIIIIPILEKNKKKPFVTKNHNASYRGLGQVLHQP